MRSLRGQTTVEMIVVIGFLLVVFTLMVLAAYTKTVESNDLKAELDAKRVARSVADNINTVAEQGPGYYRFFTLPQNIFAGENYTLEVIRNFVGINWTNRYGPQAYSLQIVTANATQYCVEKGSGKPTKVFNYDGRVFLTCNRPDFLIKEDTFEPTTARRGVRTKFSVEVFNYGILDAVDVNVTFSSPSPAGIGMWNHTIVSIAADSSETVSFYYTPPMATAVGQYVINVSVDQYNLINESFEGDNQYNATITIT